MVLHVLVRRFFSHLAADRMTGGALRDDDDLSRDLQLLEVTQVPDLSGGMWLIVDRRPSAHESTGPG